jgi:DNA-binding NarL/FixJ family response regulator
MVVLTLNPTSIKSNIAMPNKIKLLVVCSDTLSCLSLCELLSKEKDFVVDCKSRELEVTTLDKTIRSFQKSDPDILFLCSHFLIKEGTDIIGRIKEEKIKAKIVIFNSHFSLDQELPLVKEGVVGILNANLDISDLIKALKKVHAGELWLRRELISILIGGPHLDSSEVKISEGSNPHLTERELEILSLMADDYKNREISYRLCISEATVKTHMHKIYRKLKVNDRLQAIVYAKKYFLNSKKLTK